MVNRLHHARAGGTARQPRLRYKITLESCPGLSPTDAARLDARSAKFNQKS